MKKILLILSLILIMTGSLSAQTKTAKKAPSTKATASSTSKADLSASISRGKVVYESQCRSCHQADGGGVPNMNPPLIKTSYVLGNKNRLIKIVVEGFKERVEIDGETFSNIMPPHPTLTDQQVADVLTYVRNSFGNKASAVKPSEVKTVRASLKK